MSRIEQLIGEIEEYIDSCKFQPLSSTKILVNKEELEELLVELRLRVPDEIKKYQKIISQEESILSEARSQADTMLAEANAHTNELVNEHEIMKKAYAQADQILQQARTEADQILQQARAEADQVVDSAVTDANNIRQSSINYTDDMLRNLQVIIRHSMEEAGGYFNSLQSSLQSSYDIVTSNRNELTGSIAPMAGEAPGQQ